jgi:AcrR family transcriptional regulator
MDEKRLEILERASAVYMKYGLKSVTMDDLARELGMSKKTIYKYFDDKNDMIRSIMELKVEMDKAVCMNCSIQANNAIEDLITFSKLIAEHFNNINPTVIYDLRKHYQDAWQIMNAHKWDFVLTSITENINRGIKEGIYRKDVDVNVIARLYVASIDDLFDTDIFPWPEFKFQQVFTELIRYHLRGLVNEKGIKILNQKQENEEF